MIPRRGEQQKKVTPRKITNNRHGDGMYTRAQKSGRHFTTFRQEVRKG